MMQRQRQRQRQRIRMRILIAGVVEGVGLLSLSPWIVFSKDGPAKVWEGEGGALTSMMLARLVGRYG